MLAFLKIVTPLIEVAAASSSSFLHYSFSFAPAGSILLAPHHNRPAGSLLRFQRNFGGAAVCAAASSFRVPFSFKTFTNPGTAIVRGLRCRSVVYA